MRRHLFMIAPMVLVAALLGCFAELDWRELRSAAGGFSVLFPARPLEASRPVAGAVEAVMHQWSCKAAGSVWAVAYLDLTESARRAPAQAVIRLRDALLANIDGRVLAERALRLEDAAGVETRARGRSAGAEVELNVRILARGRRLYQLAVLGAPGAAGEEGLRTFFDSFRLLATPP